MRSISSEAAWRKSLEAAGYECYAEEGKQCAAYSWAQSVISIFQWPTTVRTTESYIDGFTKRTKCLNHYIKLSFWIHSALWQTATLWSAIQEFSLHVASRKLQKRRKVHAGSIQAVNSCHEWTPFSWRQRRDPSVTYRQITLHTLCWTTVRPVSSQLNQRWGESLSAAALAQICRKFCDFSLVSLFILAAEVAWDLSNLSRRWRHINLHSHFQPALPCCTEKRRTRPFWWKVQRPIV